MESKLKITREEYGEAVQFYCCWTRGLAGRHVMSGKKVQFLKIGRPVQRTWARTGHLLRRLIFFDEQASTPKQLLVENSSIRRWSHFQPFLLKLLPLTGTSFKYQTPYHYNHQQVSHELLNGYNTKKTDTYWIKFAKSPSQFL